MLISARASTFQTEDGAAMMDYVLWKNLRSFYNRIEDLRKTTEASKEGLQDNERLDWVARDLLTGDNHPKDEGEVESFATEEEANPRTSVDNL